MHIYIIQNKINGRVYVGQTTRSNPVARWNQHKSKEHNRGLKHDMKKYGVKNFIFQVVAEAMSQEQLNTLETLWHWALRSTEHQFGYNKALGGNGQMSSTTRIKHRRNLRKAMTAEVVEKIRQGKLGPKNPQYGGPGTMLGRKLTEAQKQKMRDRWAERRRLGLRMNLSEEDRAQRRRQAADMRARKKKMREVDHTDHGLFTETSNSCVEVSRET